MFECTSLASIRQKYNLLFPDDITTVQQFVWQDRTVDIILYLRECFDVILDGHQ